MRAIIKFFTGIADLLSGAIDFLIGFIADIVYLVRLTGKAVSAIPGLFALLPSSAVALIGVIFTVVVLYKILGREG